MDELEELHELVKCGICHEKLITPVLTHCSHSFCSLCIRKWLATKQVCPACERDTAESSLRRNPVVANIIEALERIEKRKTGAAKTSHSKISPQVRLSSLIQQESPNTDDDSDSDLEKNNFKKDSVPTTSNALPQVQDRKRQQYTDDFLPKSEAKQTPPRTPSTHKFSAAQSTTSNINQSPVTSKVPCPVCSCMVAESIINIHLDKCLMGGSGSTRSSVSSVVSSPSSSRTDQKSVKKNSSVENVNPPLQPIKKMVYNLMPDSQLKKELKKFGLASHGDRKTLMGRLQRYVILHNSECDSTNPRSLDELRKHFEKEEKAVGAPTKNNTFSSMFRTKQPDEEEFDSACKEYRTQHKQSYQSLIESIKTRDRTKKTNSQVIPKASQPIVVKDSSDEEMVSGASKNVKRKVRSIESDDSEDEFDRPEKRLSKERSPVLVRKTATRRKLRSKDQVPERQVTLRTRNQLKKKEEPLASEDNDADDLLLFDTPSSPSSSGSLLPCKQPSRIQLEDSGDESGGDALSQLVQLMDNDDKEDSGSTTDFEN